MTASSSRHAHGAIASAALALIGSIGIGCATPAERAPRVDPPKGTVAGTDDPRFGVFVRQRVDAVLGERLFVPIELAGGFRPSDLGPVMLDDGRRLSARLIWFEVETALPRPEQWLPPEERWIPIEFGAKLPEGMGRRGFWAIVGDPPIDAVGQGIWIAGRRVPINWLPDPIEVAKRVPAEAWSSPVDSLTAASRRLRRTIEPAALSPSRRWRAQLFTNGLTVNRSQRVVDAEGRVDRRDPVTANRPIGPVFASPVVEHAARLAESKWLVGLARLYEADPALNRAVRRRLTAYVDFGSGAVAPVWPPSGAPLRALLSDLLDQTLQPRERARRASLWLDRHPPGLVWIQSDGGLRTPAGAPVTTVGIANLSWDTAGASVEPFDGSAPPTLATVPARSAVSLASPSRSDGAAQAAVVASVAGRERALRVSRADLVASPPALRIESLHADWTMQDLLAAGQTRAAAGIDAPVPGSTFQLYRDHLDRWVLYGVLDAEPLREDSPDRLVVSLGAIGSSRDREIVVRPDGSVESRSLFAGSGDLDRPEPVEFETGRFIGGWFVRLYIPVSSIEETGTLRLGLQRVDSSGLRAAWPRRMLPWQESVGRGVIDLTRWDG